MKSPQLVSHARRAFVLWLLGSLSLACFESCLPRGDLDATGAGSGNAAGAPSEGGAGGQSCMVSTTGTPRVGEHALAFEAESADEFFSPGGTAWTPERQETALGGAWLSAETSQVFDAVTSPCDAPRADYVLDVTRAGTYFVWLLGDGRDEGAELQLGLDGEASDQLAVLEAASPQWLGTAASGKRLEVRLPAPGRHLFHLWLRAGTPALDQIYLTREEDLLPLLSTDFAISPTATRLATHFNKRADAEGWVGGANEEPLSAHVDQGRLLVSPVENEVVISHYDLQHDAEALTRFEIVGNFPEGVSATVYFARSGNDFIETDSVSLPPTTVEGAQTLLIDLAEDPDFSGMMSSFRLKFSNATGPVEIDSLRFLAPPLIGIDADCERGIANAAGNACCPLECGLCGGDGCGQTPLGPEICCASGPLSSSACLSAESPCKYPR